MSLLVSFSLVVYILDFYKQHISAVFLGYVMKPDSFKAKIGPAEQLFLFLAEAQLWKSSFLS